MLQIQLKLGLLLSLCSLPSQFLPDLLLLLSLRKELNYGWILGVDNDSGKNGISHNAIPNIIYANVALEIEVPKYAMHCDNAVKANPRFIFFLVKVVDRTVLFQGRLCYEVVVSHSNYRLTLSFTLCVGFHTVRMDDQHTKLCSLWRVKMVCA